MTATPEVDDPVARVLAWRLANERRAALVEQARKVRYRNVVPVVGKQCHYCDQPATTRDHIVPRSRVRCPGGEANIVPACLPCNQRKADQRSACTCRKCNQAWRRFGPISLL